MSQYNQIIEFIKKSNYAARATHQDVNPINEHDCAMLIMEYTYKLEVEFGDLMKENCYLIDYMRQYPQEEFWQKDELIEKMAEALKDAYEHICPDGDPLDARELEVCNKIEAALDAREAKE